jgi:dynein light intermediate chain 1
MRCQSDTEKSLLAGDHGSGKSTLISHLSAASSEAGPSNPVAKRPAATPISQDSSDRPGLGLTFSHVDISDDGDEGALRLLLSQAFGQFLPAETVARFGIYQLASSQPAFASLLPLALTPSTLLDSLVVIVLDWAQPWTFLESLCAWLAVLKRLIAALQAQQDPSSGAHFALDEGRDTGASATTLCAGRVDFRTQSKRYGGATSSQWRRTGQAFRPSPPWPARADRKKLFRCHRGLSPISLASTSSASAQRCVASVALLCTRWTGRVQSDLIDGLERDKDFKEEQIDYIQQALRTICLQRAPPDSLMASKLNAGRRHLPLLHLAAPARDVHIIAVLPLASTLRITRTPRTVLLRLASLAR